MSWQLKLSILLIWVQGGDGRRLHTLLEMQKEVGGFSEWNLPEQLRSAGGDENGETPKEAGAARLRRSSEGLCALHSILLQVRDLGLGYNSDEMVMFKYCSGTCQRIPSNHDLTLANLRMTGTLPQAVPWHHTPCCRPTDHEDLAFLDNTHRWHKVEKLSASACSCVG